MKILLLVVSSKKYSPKNKLPCTESAGFYKKSKSMIDLLGVNLPPPHFSTSPHPFPKILRRNGLDFGIWVSVRKRLGDAAFLFGVPLEFERLDF